jgi:hypothetical protein
MGGSAAHGDERNWKNPSPRHFNLFCFLSLRRHAIIFPFISWDSLTKTLWSYHCAFREDARCPK